MQITVNIVDKFCDSFLDLGGGGGLKALKELI